MENLKISTTQHNGNLTDRNNVHVILVIDCGLPQDPEVFYTEQAAGLLFEKSITTKEIGFRPKIETESWQQYHDHFLNYSNSEEVKYDTMDWEIHWFGVAIPDTPIPDTNTGTISWSVDDFEQRAREKEIELLEEQDPKLHAKFLKGKLDSFPEQYVIYNRKNFVDALRRMIHKHDATIGISWDTVDYYLDELCKI